MEIVLASAPILNQQADLNLQTMIRCIREHKGKADLILFGESVLQGFDCLRWDHEKDLHTAVALTDAPITAMRAVAKENAIAVSFGFIERCSDLLYSSQLFIGANGEIADIFHRVSPGWKPPEITDAHYCEGKRFHAFSYGGKRIATALCGDLWTPGKPEEIKALGADIVLWPVWCDYDAAEWNTGVKLEYAQQAALCGTDVLLVNPFCADCEKEERAAGSCAHFQNGVICKEQPSGIPGSLIINIP